MPRRTRVGIPSDWQSSAYGIWFQSRLIMKESVSPILNEMVEEIDMTSRYTVYDQGKPFATVHATSAAEAIRIACEKVKGHDSAACTIGNFTGPKLTTSEIPLTMCLHGDKISPAYVD